MSKKKKTRASSIESSTSLSSPSPTPTKRRRSLRNKTPTATTATTTPTNTPTQTKEHELVEEKIKSKSPKKITPSKTKNPPPPPPRTPATTPDGHNKKQKSNSSSSSSSTSTTAIVVQKKSPTKSSNDNKKKNNIISSVKPQLAVHVHRFRNAKHIPNGILKLCATPSPLVLSSSQAKSIEGNSNTIDPSIAPHIAISREGGAVELISIDENWKCVGIVEGMKKRNVDSMAWICGKNTTGITTNNEHKITTISSNNNINNTNTSSNHNQGNYFSPKYKIHEQIQTQRRLFGSSRDGTIFEIDFQSKAHVGVIGSGGGAVFCLESLCPRCSSSSISSNIIGCGSGNCCNLIAAGCEDGSVRIFKAVDRIKNGNHGDSSSNAAPSLELISTLPSVGCAITSIAWVPPPPSSSSSSNVGLQGSVIYAGAADGTIRKFTSTSIMQHVRATGSVPHAMSTGLVLTSSSHDPSNATIESPSLLHGLQWKATARLTVENRGERVATKIWTLKALDDGTLISGDSIGNVQFWDGHSGTLLQSFEHNSKGADVLDIAVTLDQTKVMASGVDAKVIYIELDKESKTSNKWVMTYVQRGHENDVNSLAMVYLTDPNKSVKSTKQHSTYRELLCSGGIDTKVCSYFVSKMRKYRPKIAYKYPTNVPVALSRKPRILTIMRSDKVDFFQLGDKRPGLSMKSVGVALDEDKSYLGSVRIASNYNLMSYDINDDGTLLAVSHAAGMHLFALELQDGYDKDGIIKIVKPSKIDVPIAVNASCSSLKFARRDPTTLISANCNGTINVISIKRDPEDKSYSVSVEHSFARDEKQLNFSNHYPITQLDVSPDGRWLATGRNTLGKGCVDLYQLKPTYKYWWTIPCTEAPFSCMKWLGNDMLVPAIVVALNSGAFYLFDPEQRRLSDWSQDLGFPAGPHLPKEICHYLDRPDRLVFHDANPTKFLMVSRL